MRDKTRDLAVAYSIKRKNAKKRMVNESAKTEHRPMPSEVDKDSQSVARNSAQKAPSMDKMTDQPERRQTGPRSPTPLKHPKIVGSSAFTTRLRDGRDLEDDLLKNIPPRKMAHGGEVDTEVDPISRPDTGWGAIIVKKANGGMINAEEDQDPDLEVSRQDDEDLAPPVDEYMSQRMAEGGMLDDEMEDEEDSSIASAIMAKRRRMAEGGQVDIDSNGEEQPNGYYARNEDAALKENYDEDMDDVSQPMDSNEMSPEHDEEDIDDASIVSAIRRKMKSRSPITR